MTRQVWVLAEHDRGKLKEVALELVCEGRRLADKLGDELCAVLMGHKVEGMAHILASYGADKVFMLDDELLAEYDADAYVPALSSLVTAHLPSILLIAATSAGGELAARVAVRIGTELVTGCTLLEITKEGFLAMTRPSYGGRVNITVVCPSAKPQMATVRPGVVRMDKPDQSRKAEVVEVTVKVKRGKRRTRIVGFVKGDPRTMDLSEAEVIVAGGRGVGAKEKFRVIEELADLLGGCVGGTRCAVDAGWIPFERQIGQIGKTVAPRCYIACGISGAIQHVMGIKDSRRIIAINVDRNAPIFKLADIGIVGDLHKVMPALIKELQELMQTTRSTQ